MSAETRLDPCSGKLNVCHPPVILRLGMLFHLLTNAFLRGCFKIVTYSSHNTDGDKDSATDFDVQGVITELQESSV